MTVTRDEYGAVYEKNFRATARYLYATRKLSPDVCEEYAQAAWVLGWERLHQLRDPKLLPYWVSKIALNMAQLAHRREQFNVALDSVEGLHDAGAPCVLKQPTQIDAVFVREIMDSLTPREKETVEALLDGQTSGEVAKQNGQSHQTHRVRAFRLRMKLKSLCA